MCFRAKYTKIRHFIWATRKKHCITQSELAYVIDVDRSLVSKWENGKKLPDFINLLKLGIALSTPIEYLYTKHYKMLKDEMFSRKEVVYRRISQRIKAKRLLAYRFKKTGDKEY